MKFNVGDKVVVIESDHVIPVGFETVVVPDIPSDKTIYPAFRNPVTVVVPKDTIIVGGTRLNQNEYLRNDGYRVFSSDCLKPVEPEPVSYDVQEPIKRVRRIS